jgi:hypothetical protein
MTDIGEVPILLRREIEARIAGPLIEAFAEAFGRDALERDILEKSETQYNYNIVRCKYAEMYKSLGLEDMGFLVPALVPAASMQNPLNPWSAPTTTAAARAEFCVCRPLRVGPVRPRATCPGAKRTRAQMRAVSAQRAKSWPHR